MKKGFFSLSTHHPSLLAWYAGFTPAGSKEGLVITYFVLLPTLPMPSSLKQDRLIKSGLWTLDLPFPPQHKKLTLYKTCQLLWKVWERKVKPI